MGIKPHYIKDICRDIMEKYSHLITTDFDLNKEFLNQNAEISSKKLRNLIAGRLVIEKKNEHRIILPPYTGKPKKRKGWKKKEKIRNRRRNNR